MSELEPQPHPPAAFSETAERRLVWLLCALTAVHVFVFSAAFPFFNNVDERQHFDTVLKYAHGQFPHRLEMQSDETARYLDDYDSSEFLWTPETFPGGRYPSPPWKPSAEKPDASRQNAENPSQAQWLQMAKVSKPGRNYESSQPPLYYSLAGLWWHLGEWCGATGLHLLYWLRFLNVLLVAALAWVGYAAARTVFPESQFVRLGVPTLVAFMPQTAFYSITNDVLSPLCCGAVFICLIHLWRTEIPGMKLGVITGLALAAVFLTKISNLPLLAVSAAWVLLKCRRLSKSGKLRAAVPSLGALALAAGLPAASWLAWCKLMFGDFTGSTAKVHSLGWTHKPFADWWHHPIFTPRGLWEFVSELMRTFWQGEIWWHGQPLHLPAVDAFYVIPTLCLLGLAVAELFRRSDVAVGFQRDALWLILWNVIAAVGFLAWLSIIFNFGNCVYPSQEHPYFGAGRLMLGALIPFLLLLLFGVNALLLGIKNKWARPVALAGAAAFMLASEIATNGMAFSSEFNWFHL